jgi:hypothetical protein
MYTLRMLFWKNEVVFTKSEALSQLNNRVILADFKYSTTYASKVGFGFTQHKPTLRKFDTSINTFQLNHKLGKTKRA